MPLKVLFCGTKCYLTPFLKGALEKIMKLLDILGEIALKLEEKRALERKENLLKKNLSDPVPFQILGIGTSSVPVPKISERFPERERKFRSGPITASIHASTIR